MVKQRIMASQFAPAARGAGGHIWVPLPVSAARSRSSLIEQLVEEIDAIRAVAGAEAPTAEPSWSRRQAMTLTLGDARAYVAEVRWQFAKTMPQWPHEYTLHEWRPDLGRTFDAFVQLIWTKGVVKPWPPPPARAKYHHHYLELDGWEYWVMTEGPWVGSSLINRARLDPSPAASSSERATD